MKNCRGRRITTKADEKRAEIANRKAMELYREEQRAMAQFLAQKRAEVESRGESWDYKPTFWQRIVGFFRSLF